MKWIFDKYGVLPFVAFFVVGVAAAVALGISTNISDEEAARVRCEAAGGVLVLPPPHRAVLCLRKDAVIP